MLFQEGPTFLLAKGAELEEGLGSISLQAGEDSTVTIRAHGEELRASLWRRLLSHSWVTHRRVMDVSHCYTD